MTTAPRFDTLCAAFQYVATIDPDAVALRTPGDAQTMTWREYATQVRMVAAGLDALGVRRGDTVALMMANRIDFYPLEVGAQHLGATSFSVYNTLSTDQIAHVLGNANPRVVICEPQYVPRIIASGVSVDHIVCVDEAPEGTVPVAQLLAAGKADFNFETAWLGVQSEDIATLIYTSGTTGHPKGVETTHANLMFEAYAVHDVLGVHFGDTITSFMPTAHIADRLTALYFQEVFGTQITCVAHPGDIAAALADLRPTIWGAVPRVWEKLKAAIELAATTEPDTTRRQAMQWALGVATNRGTHRLSGKPVPDSLEAEWARADELVLSSLRTKLGFDRIRWAMSGAAPIAPETLGFFAGLGIPIAEIWGMSELTCISSVSHPHDAKLGTVGRMLPGMDARLAADGELLVRGPLVMKGYRSEPEKTAEAIDQAGWLSTGDIVTIDDEGFLRIIDRKKEMIINAAGKNMSPSNIENACKAASSLIGTIAVIGDARPYNTALVVLDAETALGFAHQHDLPTVSAAEMSSASEIIAAIQIAIATGNQRLSRVEQVKRFRILPSFWEPGGDEMTPTMKLKRRVIADKYSSDIADLYSDRPTPGVHEPLNPSDHDPHNDIGQPTQIRTA